MAFLSGFLFVLSVSMGMKAQILEGEFEKITYEKNEGLTKVEVNFSEDLKKNMMRNAVVKYDKAGNETSRYTLFGRKDATGWLVYRHFQSNDSCQIFRGKPPLVQNWCNLGADGTSIKIGVGKKSLELFRHSQADFSAHGNLYCTAQGIPVLFEVEGADSLTEGICYGMSRSIADRSVLDLPQSCQSQPST